MALFEAKAAAVASALTLLVLTLSLNSAFAQEDAVTDAARSARPAGGPVPPTSVPCATTAPVADGQPPGSTSRVTCHLHRHRREIRASRFRLRRARPPAKVRPCAADLPQDLSAWGMFLHADRIVKTVMIGLALASLLTWAVWLAKSLELRRARSEVQRDLRILANCSTLAEAHERLLKGRSSVAQLMARLVVCAREIPIKLSMMPQTVPNSPTNGAVEPIVASTPVPRAILRLAVTSIRSSCHAMRSFRPSARSLIEARISSAAPCISCATELVPLTSCPWASASVLQLASRRRSF